MDFVSYNLVTVNINNITNPTKLDALRTFLRTMDSDIVFLQELENDKLCLPGYNVICNVDHGRRGTAIALKDYISFSHVEKSLDSRVISVRVHNTTLVCIYAHSGSSMRAERERLFNHTIAYYLRHDTPHTILAGDFNCVLRRCDSSGHNDSPSLRATVQQLQLSDVWVKLRPQIAGHTYVSVNSSSRLDRFYVSPSLCNQLRTIETHVCSFSDHKAVTVRLCLPTLGRAPGRGFWSIRPHLLTQENIEEFRYQWQYWTRQRRNYPSWMMWWISYVKPKIKKFFRWKSKLAFDVFNREYQRLYTQLQRAYDNLPGRPDILTTINRTKAMMLSLQRNFTHMFIRINETYVAGEEMSTFQLGERRRKRTAITQLRNEDGEIIHQSGEIEQNLLRYFTDLYNETQAEAAIDDEFNCERIIPEDDVANEACGSEISTTEVMTAIRTSANRKSPGTDGIPKEFYHRTFDIIHRELNLVLNDALAGRFPPEFVDGVIVLVKKKDGDGSARSFRPISLLNVDFKILSRILKARLELVMREHRLLSSAQKCSNPPRNIFQATLSLKDRLAYLIQSKQRGKMITWDLDHAFDRVRRSFLYNTMRSLGFHRGLVDLLAQIDNLSSSRLLINGHLSAPFAIRRSVRQGSPLSMHLFVLYLHPLISKLEQLHGDDLVVAYADDITVVSTSIDRIEQMRNLFSRFERISGAKVNWEKTKSLDVGFIEGNPLYLPWLRTENTVRVLGVIYANSIRLMVRLNWDEMLAKFSQRIWLNSLRSLTIMQKVILLNTFVTSKVWYLASILSPYCVHTAKITTIMGRFIWNNIVARIPMQQLARERKQGGLKLHLPTLKSPALLINRHIKELDSMPYYKSLLFRDNPDRNVIPADLPDLRIICQKYQNLPAQILQNLSSDLLHRFFVDQTEPPRVERVHPRVDWKRIWTSLHWRAFTSVEKSNLYLLTNEKGPHRELLHTIGRADSNLCLHCNTTLDTMQHRYCECPRVHLAWEYLQRKMREILGGWRRLQFTELARPVLNRINKNNRILILKLFIHYVTFVNSHNNQIDINALEFYLNSELI